MNSQTFVQTTLPFKRSDSSTSNSSSVKRKRSDSNGELPPSPSKMSYQRSKRSDGNDKPGNQDMQQADFPPLLSVVTNEVADLPLGLPSSQDRYDSEDYSPGSHSNRSEEDEEDHDSYVMVNATKYWGVPIDQLPQAPHHCPKLPHLQEDASHLVYFKPPLNLQDASVLPEPLEGEYCDDWFKENEVKMPCSSGSLIPCLQSPGGTRRRWELIEETLEKPIPGSFELEGAILTYNQHYCNRWNFDSLHTYFKNCGYEDRNTFFATVLPKMAELACLLPLLFKRAIPFLVQRENRKLTFSQQQVACLLANAFFCTFPRRNLRTRGGHYPDINFSSLFSGPADNQKVAKIKCIMHYFGRITQDMPKGVVTYERKWMMDGDYVNWAKSQEAISKLHTSADGVIEDVGQNMLQMDFANKYVGGGVLGHGCVQEEIRFMICPEMIVSRLFTELLLDSEVLVMTGCERFSSYTGYSKTFGWDGDHVDKISRDAWGRRYTEVVAADARHFKRHEDQFQESLVRRELDKVYCAFRETNCPTPTAVCTGNWGCGAFGGDPELKALLQILAASQAMRDVCFLTVGNTALCKDLYKLHTNLRENNVKVGELYDLILTFSKKRKGSSLLKFLASNF